MLPASLNYIEWRLGKHSGCLQQPKKHGSKNAEVSFLHGMTLLCCKTGCILPKSTFAKMWKRLIALIGQIEGKLIPSPKGNCTEKKRTLLQRWWKMSRLNLITIEPLLNITRVFDKKKSHSVTLFITFHMLNYSWILCKLRH